jgi:hypothetical protein
MLISVMVGSFAVSKQSLGFAESLYLRCRQSRLDHSNTACCTLHMLQSLVTDTLLLLLLVLQVMFYQAHVPLGAVAEGFFKPSIPRPAIGQAVALVGTDTLLLLLLLLLLLQVMFYQAHVPLGAVAEGFFKPSIPCSH